MYFDDGGGYIGGSKQKDFSKFSCQQPKWNYSFEGFRYVSVRADEHKLFEQNAIQLKIKKENKHFCLPLNAMLCSLTLRILV